MNSPGVPSIEEVQLDHLALLYSQREGDSCARSIWSRNHLFLFLAFADVALYFSLCGTLTFFTATILFLSFSMTIAILFRLVVIVLSIVKNPQIKVSRRECLATADTELPIYTILVPLYREANVARTVIRALSRLEYPREKLDIKLLLEQDDDLTAEAISQIELGPEFDLIWIPPSYPRTKPKACNHGLSCARGEFTVIYDAEDQPEADQLLKAVSIFRQVDEEVACLQAKLNYFNARENFITRCFALEYTAWFEMLLPGFQYLDAPIPLGGTSNHFRTRALKELGGWDPFNVTEDCDLGIRISIRNYRTLLFDSTTLEEANTRAGNWIRQRSRWVKGYLQTLLVHTKHPVQLLKALGPLKTLYFVLAVGGVAVMQLINLVLWSLLLLFLVLLTIDVANGRDAWTVIAGSRDEYRLAWKMLYVGPGEDPIWSKISVLAFFSSVSMLFANGIFILINLCACSRRQYRDLWMAALLSPIYWAMGSIAAWKGAIQLIRAPHYWEKTNHGLSCVSTEVQPSFESIKDEQHELAPSLQPNFSSE